MRQTAIPETGPEKQPTSCWVPELQPPQLDEDLVRKGVERLLEIFMAPEVLKSFTRFVSEVEAGQRAQSEFVSVTAAATISLVTSGEIVLLESQQGRTLPPGVAKRLTETAEALSLIYGNRHR